MQIVWTKIIELLDGWETEMTEDELIEALKKNLRIVVQHPQQDVGYYDTFMRPDEYNIEVELFYKDTLICSDKSEL